MGLKVAKAHKLGGPAWEVRSAQPVSSRPHALCRTSRARPLPGGPSSWLRNVSSLFCACAPAAGPPQRSLPRYLVRRPSALSMRLPRPSFLLCLFSSLLQPLPTSSSWMHHHRAPFSPHLKWASRVIELENATNRRGSSLCHPGQFVSASAVLPRPVMLLCCAMQCCYRQSDSSSTSSEIVTSSHPAWLGCPAPATLPLTTRELDHLGPAYRAACCPGRHMDDVCTRVTIPTCGILFG